MAASAQQLEGGPSNVNVYMDVEAAASAQQLEGGPSKRMRYTSMLDDDEDEDAGSDKAAGSEAVQASSEPKRKAPMKSRKELCAELANCRENKKLKQAEQSNVEQAEQRNVEQLAATREQFAQQLDVQWAQGGMLPPESANFWAVLQRYKNMEPLHEL